MTVVPTSNDGATDRTIRDLREAGIATSGAPKGLSFDGHRCAFEIDGTAHAFDALYPMPGSRQTAS